jgi:isopentenyldiphosphate isomerase/intracellular septation protein A
MNTNSLSKRDLLKNFTIGFIPLLIFIIADAIFGTRIGLIIAILVGVVEFAYYYLRHKRIESFILFDVALIIALGTVSILLENELFFKLKPALIELILALLLGVHAFSDKPLLLTMGKRFLKDLAINENQMRLMRQMTRLLFTVVMLHIILVAYAAFYMSNQAWAFISGGLFYIIFGLLMAGQWLYFRMKKPIGKIPSSLDGEEWFDLVNEGGKVTGKAPRSAVHGNPQLLHPVVHLHIFNKNGQIYLQKRALSKEIQPGKWDTAVGGHILSGEDALSALHREANEELGITDGHFQPLYTYIMRNEIESELIYTFRMISNGPFKINPDEIVFGKFWRIADVRYNIGKNIFTPNFEQEFQMLQNVLMQNKSKK